MKMQTISSFEEFHTLQRRLRAKLEAGARRERHEFENSDRMVAEQAPFLDDKKGLSLVSIKESGLKSQEKEEEEISLTYSRVVKSMGRIAERDEVQLAIVFLIFLDLVCSNGLLVLSDWNDGSDEIMLSFIYKALHSVTFFTIISFILELLALMMGFGRDFFQHKGYVLDTIVVLVCLCFEGYSSSVDDYITAGKEVRLLGFIRLWRIVRLVESTVRAVTSQHEVTKLVLEDEQLRTEELRLDVAVATENTKREVDARRQVEKMLRRYKEEIDTLNEALRLAALDVASAGYKDALLTQQAEDDRPSSMGEETDERKKKFIVIHQDGTFHEQPSASEEDDNRVG